MTEKLAEKLEEINKILRADKISTLELSDVKQLMDGALPFNKAKDKELSRMHLAYLDDLDNAPLTGFVKDFLYMKVYHDVIVPSYMNVLGIKYNRYKSMKSTELLEEMLSLLAHVKQFEDDSYNETGKSFPEITRKYSRFLDIYNTLYGALQKEKAASG